MNYRIIPTERIKKDFIYSFSFPDEVNLLSDSIRKFGVLDPIIVERDTMQVISGKKRILACKKIGKTDVPAIMVSKEEDMSRYLEKNLHITVSERGLNFIEKCNIINKLRKLDLSEEELYGRFFYILNLPVRKDIFDLSKWINSLNYSSKSFIVNRDIRIEVLQKAKRLGGDGKSILTFLSQTGFGNNKCKSFINDFSDLTRDSNISFDELIGCDELRDVVPDEKNADFQKGKSVKEMIYKLKYPVLNHYREQFIGLLHDCKLEKPLFVDKTNIMNMETDFLDFKLRIHNIDDIEKCIALLNDEKNKKAIKMVLVFLKKVGM